MLKLYGGAPRSRASMVQWYLEELEVPYEIILLNMQADAQRQPQYLAINPIGKLPTIIDEGFKLWESGAILLYLAEKYEKLPTTLKERAAINQWVLFANSTLISGLFLESNREPEIPRLLEPLNHIFEQQVFLLGDIFTVADVALGGILAYIPSILKLDLSEYPLIKQYIHRLSIRPAYQRSIGKYF